MAWHRSFGLGSGLRRLCTHLAGTGRRTRSSADGRRHRSRHHRRRRRHSDRHELRPCLLSRRCTCMATPRAHSGGVRRLKLLVVSASVKIPTDYQWESVGRRFATCSAPTASRGPSVRAPFSAKPSASSRQWKKASYGRPKFDGAEEVTAAQLAGLASTLSLNNFVEADLARIDASATAPSKRILPAELVILTPDIPDTLILTEITA